MRVLIACEYSGIVREAFKKKGHYAMSCDLLPTEIEGEHYQGDVFDIINDNWDIVSDFKISKRMFQKIRTAFGIRADNQRKKIIDFSNDNFEYLKSIYKS